MEEKVNTTSSGKITPFRETAKPVEIGSISMQEEDRMHTGITELDRVLGGGIMHGSLTLVGGDPGIGKKDAKRKQRNFCWKL